MAYAVNSTGASSSKRQPTQEILGKVFDEIDTAADLTECLSIVIATDRSCEGLLALANDIEQKLKTVRDEIRDLVEWAK